MASGSELRPDDSSDGTSVTPLLDEIASPDDLKGRSISELEEVAAEVRAELIRIVTRNGGHLGASLGTVELTLALHAVFD